MTAFRLGEDRLTTQALAALAAKPNPDITVTSASRQNLKKYRQVVDKILAEKQTRYGINTGFGFLANVRIGEDKLADLQVNLVRSHACGVGAPVSDDIVRGLLLLRAHTFLLGHTGISEECFDTILAFLKHDVLPVVPEKGSVGASGDLAPLSHLALGLMGEGEVRYHGEKSAAEKVCRKLGITPHTLAPKEGLSLINGTHFMAVLGAFAVEEARVLLESANVAAALSLDAIRGTTRIFDERIHKVRPQLGQSQVAAHMRKLFIGKDEINESHKDCAKVQDPYSFRCIPQVHGASLDVWRFVADRFDIELNSVTDNPLCFDDGEILSGGNFHGQPVAMALDFLAIAMAELGSIAERRIEKLTNPAMSGLPAFLMQESGLNSGFMIPHVVAAALVSENKVLSHPAVVDTIPTSADQEDHVSMGPIAGRKCRQVIENVANIMAIEVLAACQGIDLVAPLKPSPILNTVYKKVREISPKMDADRSLHHDILKVKDWIMEGGLLAIMQDHKATLLT